MKTIREIKLLPNHKFLHYAPEGYYICECGAKILQGLEESHNELNEEQMWSKDEVNDIIRGCLKDIDVSIQSTRNMCKIIEIETLQQLQKELKEKFTKNNGWDNDYAEKWIHPDIAKVFNKYLQSSDSVTMKSSTQSLSKPQDNGSEKVSPSPNSEPDYPHDKNCEGTMCYCKNRAKREDPEKWKKYMER